MVECKFFSRRSTISSVEVLIDTWWNVNHKANNVIKKGLTVLIDTWWNVNYFVELGISKRLTF